MYNIHKRYDLVPLRDSTRSTSGLQFVSSNKQKEPWFQVLARILARSYARVFALYFRYTQVLICHGNSWILRDNWKLSGKYCLRSTFALLFSIDESANSFTNFFHFVSNYLWFILSRLLIQEITNNLYKSFSSHLIHINVFRHLEAKNTNHRRTGNFLPGEAVNHLPKKFLQVAQISTKQHSPY